MQRLSSFIRVMPLAILLLAGAAGCSTPAQHRAGQTQLDLRALSGTMRANVVAERLVPGMTPDLVYVILGAPGRNRTLEPPEFRPGATWTYRGELVRGDSDGLIFKTSKDWVWMTRPDQVQTLEVRFGPERVERITWRHPDGRSRSWPD